MTDRTKENKNKSVDELISVGADIAGGVSGTVLGFFTGGATGAILGSTAGVLLAHTFRGLGVEIKSRILGPREEIRVGAAIAFAAKKVQENLAIGSQLRQDNFFQKRPDQRAPAEEIVEGMLLVAQREYEEKKIRFYGNLVANICFHPEIDRAHANLLIRSAEQISYQQICLLVLFTNKKQFALREMDYREEAEKLDPSRVGLLMEIYDLYSRNMLNASGHALIGGPLAIIPAKMNVQAHGAVLYNLMEIWEIDVQDVDEITKLLR